MNTIIYRDEIGYVVDELDTSVSIMFFDGFVYFTNSDEKDFKIRIDQLSEITSN